MYFVVEKIEDNILVLEDIKNGRKKEININEINFNVKENDVLLFDGKKYIIDNKTKEERIKKIKEKMKKLKFDA